MNRSRPVSPTPAHQAKLNLLRSLVIAYLAISPPSALFFAERLHALEPSQEPSSFLLASALVAAGDNLHAIWQLRQPVTFNPDPNAPDDPFGNQPGQARRNNAPQKLTRPATDCSIRCARLYATACAAVGRAKEGRETLARVLQPGLPLAPYSSSPLSLSETATSAWTDLPSTLLPLSDPATLLDLDLAHLAYTPSTSSSQADAERAILSFRKVLQRAPTCWEAIEALCELGTPPEVESLLPLPKRVPLQPVAANGQASERNGGAVGAGGGGAKPLSSSSGSNNGYPPPLGPSQTAGVNTAHQFSHANGAASSGGLFTPDVPLPNGRNGGGAGLFGLGGANGGAKGKGKEVVGLFGAVAPGLRRTGSGRYGQQAQMMMQGGDVSMLGDMTGDESSFDTSFYPAISAPSFAPSSRIAQVQAANPVSTSLFTPLTASLPTATAPGVKRTRAGNIAPASLAGEDDASRAPAPKTGRSIRGVPGGGGGGSRERTLNGGGAGGGAGGAGQPPATRRSTRLSANATSSAMAPSRSQTSATGRITSTSSNGVAGARDKKRSKAGAGPSVLSDSTGTLSDGAGVSPPYPPSSSPGPASPGASTAPLPSISSTLPPPPAVDAATLAARAEAETYVLSLLRSFAKAEVAASRFDQQGVLEALGGLSQEQGRTERAMRMMGRARFERGEYGLAEKAYLLSRQLSPASLRGLDLFSTTLWHLRSPTALSFLAQDLHSLSTPTSASSSTSPIAWIASGNVFSHLEDHAAALRCFRRASQLDSGNVYAYVLSGHECVMLEEWDRALGFFREAVRRDRGGRCYGAWFGLGNVYLKTGKYTLAEYHFRRALEINQGNVTLVCCVGTVLEKLRKPREALEMYERAVALAPESALARFKRVRLMLAFKQFQLAESDLLALKHLAPSEPNVHYLLGKLYKQLGPARRPEMLAAFASAQDLEPRLASVIREQIERPPDEALGENGMDVDDSRTESSIA